MCPVTHLETAARVRAPRRPAREGHKERACPHFWLEAVLVNMHFKGKSQNDQRV